MYIMNSEAISTIEQLARDPPQDPEARLRLYNAATQLMTSVESPQTTAQRLFHGQMPLVMAQVGNDLRLFEKIASEPKKSWTVAELACATKADTVLLHRILRCLASYDMLCEQTDGTFSATNITFNLVCPGTDAGIKHYWKTTTKAVNAIPVCLANDEYQNRLHKTPFQIAYETDLHPFEWRKHNPEHAKAAQAWMAARMTNTDSVFDGRVPLDDFKLSPTELGDGQVLLVDVGGGSGHQCVDFRRKTGSQGHIVTQDLPLVRQMQTNLSELEALDIEPMVYDFMQPQPVKNAKIYVSRDCTFCECMRTRLIIPVTFIVSPERAARLAR